MTGRNHARSGVGIIGLHVPMTGVGLLCYEVRRVSHDLCKRSNASCFLSREQSFFGDGFTFRRFFI